jgi:hypothetical protein
VLGCARTMQELPGEMMNIWFAEMTHSGWKLHDFYWLGALVFIFHFTWLSPSTLRRKNVLPSLVIMTAFWPVTYVVSIFQILRFRRLRQ